MSELDQLLQPTVAPAEKRPLPWRVSSQFWVAFLGGVPAATVIAYLNARRLGSSAATRRWILVAGFIALAISLAFAGLFGVVQEQRHIARIAMRVVAVVLFLVLARMQRDDDGRHQIFGSGTYASLWIPGIVASFASGLVLVAIIFLVWAVIR